MPFLSLVPLHLIGLEGDEHQKIRQFAQKALNQQTATRLPMIVSKKSDKLIVVKLDEYSKNNTTVENIDKLLRATALDIISEAIFGESWNALDDYSESNVKAYSLSNLMHELHWRITEYHEYQNWVRFPEREPVMSLLKPLKNFIFQEISKNKQYISSLSVAEREELLDSEYQTMLQFWVATALKAPDQLSDFEIYNLCMIFLTMGHENVATGVAWTVLKLAENKAAQDAVRQEILSKGATENAFLDPLGVRRNYPVLVNSFFEATRLYPSVPVVTRMSLNEQTILEYKIPAETEVIIPLYIIHRDPSVWGRNSAEYCPERFNKPGCPYISTSGFPDAQPFASGTRACIGQPLSLLEAFGIVSSILKKFEMASMQDHPVEPNNFISLRPGEHKIRFKEVDATLRANL